MYAGHASHVAATNCSLARTASDQLHQPDEVGTWSAKSIFADSSGFLFVAYLYLSSAPTKAARSTENLPWHARDWHSSCSPSNCDLPFACCPFPSTSPQPKFSILAPSTFGPRTPSWSSWWSSFFPQTPAVFCDSMFANRAAMRPAPQLSNSSSSRSKGACGLSGEDPPYVCCQSVRVSSRADNRWESLVNVYLSVAAPSPRSCSQSRAYAPEIE